MGQKLTYTTLGRRLVEAVPEIKEPYDALMRDWEDEAPGPHVMFGDVLNPYLLTVLASTDSATKHDEVLRRIFAFLEQLAQHDDLRVQEVVSTTVCERLGDDAAILTRARRYMGETTRRLSQEVEAFWEAEEPHEGLALIGPPGKRHDLDRSR